MSDATTNAAQRIREALQRATNRIKQLEASSREPIAVIGMACRFPGGPTPGAFWSSLAAGKDLISEFPDARLFGRWPAGVPRWAGLLDDVAGFDPGFFGISPREALSLDPQQRLLLEVAWESLEHAAVLPASLQGSKTGVFVGLTTTDYERRAWTRPAAERNAYDTTGNMLSTAAGRISYVLGLHGPAISIDTACSSSLVAVHLACQSLRTRESDLALAGGVNLILSEESTHAVALVQALSPDGRCKTFDASANGFVRGEGCGLVVLKRLSDAQRDGDTVLGLIRGSAINQDGRSTGLTAPNVLAQEALLRAAQANADVRSSQVGYLECHGTGTSLGDPIEVEALKAVFGQPRDDGSKLWLGAVKTNVGHLESAAGIAGLIKILLAFQHRQIPANLHLRRLSPRIKLSGTPLTPVTEMVDWHAIDGEHIAGVSSFGMSGTNAHVILQRAASSEPRDRRSVSVAPLPLLLSARSDAALRGQASQLRRHLDDHPELDPVDLSFSLATTRTTFERRACVLSDKLPAALDELIEHGSTPRTISAVAKPNVALALLFTGQGAQRPSMGKPLAECFPVFRDSIHTISARFDEQLDRPLLPVMFAAPGTADAALLDQTSYTQPALFAFEVALHRLLASWGVSARVLLGHSIGELAAAHIAGVWSLDDAVRMVAARGRLMQALPVGGAMLSVQASEAEVLPLLERHLGLDIAGLNGPLSTVVSGDEAPIAALEQHFVALGRKTRRLTVSHAFHSHRMDPMLADFRRIAESINYSPASIPIVSNVSGRIATADELTSPDYWVRQIRAPVRFLDGVQALARERVDVYLELGPRAVLSSMAAACLPESDEDEPEVVAAVHHDKPEVESVMAMLGALHCHGVSINWSSVFAPYQPRRVALPTYSFDRQSYWLAGSAGAESTVAASAVEPAWTRVSLPTDGPRPAGPWLIASSSQVDASLADAIAAALRAAEVECHTLTLPAGTTSAQMSGLLDESLAGAVPRAIVSLLAFDESASPDHPTPAGLSLTIELVHSLRDLDGAPEPWLLTSDAVSTLGADPSDGAVSAATWKHAASFAPHGSAPGVHLLDIAGESLAEPGVASTIIAVIAGHPQPAARLALRPDGLFARAAVDDVDEQDAVDPNTSAKLVAELASMSEREQARRVLQLTLEQLAGVLGHHDPSSIAADVDFAGLGLDSLMAVELRKRLSAETGLKLRATLAYDHPSPRQLSAALLESLRERSSEHHQADDQELRLRAALAKLSAEQLAAAGLLEPLLALAEDPAPDAGEYLGLSDDELLDAADSLLGDD